MIDIQQAGLKLHKLHSKTSDAVVNALKQEWSNRYSWQTHILNSRGVQFIGAGFQAMVKDYGIIQKRITVCNPHAIAIAKDRIK